MNNTVFLRVNGRDWGGWTSVRISAGIDRIARDFNVSITRQWPGGEDVPPVKNGDSVEVLIGDDLVITGWVEALPLRYDAQTIMTGIVGRSKTADLIDCSASPAQHNGKNLFLIASALARPFGVDVVDAGAPAAAVIEAQPEHGETVVDCLNRLLGQAQALAYDDERGRLVLGRPGSMKAATALVLGENILSCDTERSVRERFSSYRLLPYIRCMVISIIWPGICCLICVMRTGFTVTRGLSVVPGKMPYLRRDLHAGMVLPERRRSPRVHRFSGMIRLHSRPCRR